MKVVTAVLYPRQVSSEQAGSGLFNEATKPEAENTMRVIGWMSRRSLWLATELAVQIMRLRVHSTSLMSPKSDRNMIPMDGLLAWESCRGFSVYLIVKVLGSGCGMLLAWQ